MSNYGRTLPTAPPTPFPQSTTPITRPTRPQSNRMNDRRRALPSAPPTPFLQPTSPFTQPTRPQPTRMNDPRPTLPTAPPTAFPQYTSHMTPSTEPQSDDNICALGFDPSKPYFPTESYPSFPGDTDTDANGPRQVPTFPTGDRTRTYMDILEGLNRLRQPNALPPALTPSPTVPHSSSYAYPMESSNGNNLNAPVPWVSSLAGIRSGGGPSVPYYVNGSGSSVSHTNIYNAILFHESEARPRMITIPSTVNLHRYNYNPYDPASVTPSEVLDATEWFNHRDGSDVRLRYFTQIDRVSTHAHLVPRRFCICDDAIAHSTNSQSPQNRCVLEITKCCNSRINQWAGNIVVLRVNDDNSNLSTPDNCRSYRLYADVKMEEDLKAIEQYFKEYDGTEEERNSPYLKK